jgi:hypothetical protein
MTSNRLFVLLGCAFALASFLGACKSQPTATSETAPLESAKGLKAAAEFADIEDETERSKAIFGEMARVIQHPRCSNCHPAGDSPMQGDDMLPHQPLVVRGEDGFGAPGMRCGTCHGEANFGNVPGDKHWHLAPLSMAWQGVAVTDICAQLKDPERNGGKDLAGIIDHMKNDSLVAWGWAPPEHLEPAPGTQAIMGELTEAWVASGAHCP